ncbi:MAG TPA: hypothetical protein VGH59_01505 [Casimicrobiaceae bacterium]
MTPYETSLQALLGNLGGLAANRYTSSQYQMNQMVAQQAQQQNYTYEHLLGNGFLPSQPGMVAYFAGHGIPQRVLLARCSYCGKRPRASTDDRCDGCGAPR